MKEWTLREGYKKKGFFLRGDPSLFLNIAFLEFIKTTLNVWSSF